MQSAGEREKLRSQKSCCAVNATFISRTRRRVAVYWVNFSGEPVKYCELAYRHYFPIHTFETHPWIFRDALSGDVMVTSDGKEVYWPKQKNEKYRDYVIIDIPVYSLKDRSMQVVNQTFTSEEIQACDIPDSLKTELLASLNEKRAFCNR